MDNPTTSCFSFPSTARLQTETLVSLSQPLHKYVFSPAIVFWEETLQLHARQNCWRPTRKLPVILPVWICYHCYSYYQAPNCLYLVLQPSDWSWHIPSKMWKILNWTVKELTTSSVCHVAIQRGILSYLKPQGNIIVHQEMTGGEQYRVQVVW